MESAVNIIQKNKNQMEKEWIRHFLAIRCLPLKSRFLKTRTKETKINGEQTNWDGKAKAQKTTLFKLTVFVKVSAPQHQG